MDLLNHIKTRSPWNKGKLTGQKPPLKLKEIWAIRIRLQISLQVRDLALFNLAIDSKLRSCDLVKIRVRDVTQWYEHFQKSDGDAAKNGTACSI
jgi:hypothetical protein